MRLFFEWLRMKRRVILFILSMYACFFAVYALYDYAWGVAGYAALIASVFGVGFALMSFFRFLKTHRQLQNITGRFPTEALPEADGLLERDYTELAAALEAERVRLENARERQQHDSAEYYTLWAHQIKTPISAMRLMLQSRSASRADIEQELYRIEQYVAMVLQYQRLATMENDLLLQEHSIDTLVRTAVKNCAPLFIHKKLPVELGALEGTVVTDEKWMVFVLEQILGNAAKYTSRGRVSAYMAKEHLVIEDTGIGISEEDLPRIFERGFTGSVGRIERSSTGLGLYLSRSILARLGFSLGIESKQGAGTRVLISLAQERPQLD